jgi:hypothetical protein
MFIDQDIKIVGKIDFLKIQRALETILGIDWNDKKFDRPEPPLVGGRLCTLPYLIRNPEQKVYTKEQSELIKSVMPVVRDAVKLFPDYVPIRGEVVNLLPKKSLDLHIDTYWFHKHSKRVHVPLYTNDDSVQIFENRNYHLNIGYAYEINNRIMHSAANNGQTPRIHIILDLLLRKKLKNLIKNNDLIILQCKMPISEPTTPVSTRPFSSY